MQQMELVAQRETLSIYQTQTVWIYEILLVGGWVGGWNTKPKYKYKGSKDHKRINAGGHEKRY